MKRATIEVLNDGEKVFGSNTTGNYFVREYENDQEMGGSFFKTRDEAWKYITIYEEDNPERACEIYPYAKEYLNKYPNLNNETI